MAIDYLSRKEHDDKCDKLWQAYGVAHREVVVGLDEVKAAIQQRNNIDAKQEGYLLGVKDGKDGSIHSIRQWLKIIITIITILSGLGIFSTLKNAVDVRRNNNDTEKVLDAIKQIIEHN